MLDDDEFRQVMTLRDVVKDGKNLQEKSAPMLTEYERITGCRETDPKALSPPAMNRDAEHRHVKAEGSRRPFQGL